MNTPTPQAARVTLPSRSLTGATGRPARYVPAACTDIKATFAKFKRLQRLQAARAQAGRIADTLLDYLTAGAVAAGVVALLLASTDALAGTPEASANTMPVEFVGAFAIAVLALLVGVVCLVAALRASAKAHRDNAATLRHATEVLRRNQQMPPEAAGAHARAAERQWQDRAAGGREGGAT
jgi:hypothetical protein